MMPPPALEVLESDVDHAKGRAFNMLFFVWRHETTLVAYRRAIELAKQLILAFPEGIGASHIVEAEAVPPTAETRQAFVDFLRLPGLKHYSVVHEATGFKAATVRAIVGAQHALARSQCEHRVHSTIAAAAHWHAAQQRALKRSESEAQIAACLTALRAEHRQRHGA